MLRYPGGKLRLQKKFINPEIARHFPWSRGWHVGEPFVGGGGSLINMAKDFPSWRFEINDKNPVVAGFWGFVLKSSGSDFELFIKKLRAQTSMDLKEFDAVWFSKPESNFECAWWVLVINKCSYSGMMSGRYPIGGNAQKSKWPVGIYWNPPHLEKLLRQTRDLLGDRVTAIFNLDWSEFLRKTRFDFIYADPPYLPFGHGLYGQDYGFTGDDLTALRKDLDRSADSWCLSINDSAEVRKIVAPANLVVLQTFYPGDSRYRASELRANKGVLPLSKSKYNKKEIIVFPPPIGD